MDEEMKKINKLVDQANSYFDKACELKDIARKSKETYKIYLEASKRYEEASKINLEIAKILDNSQYKGEYNLTANKCVILSEYYIYEMNQCITMYYYEERNITEAKKYYKNSIIHIENAINLLSVIERNDFWEREFRVWNYFKKTNEKLYDSILAREAWDKEDYIVALDYYRKSVENEQNLIDTVKNLVNENVLEPVYERIEISNFIGMIANINASVSKIIYDKNKDNINEDTGLELLELFYKCYYLSNNAYKNNPEWNDYKNGSDIYINNIRKFLTDNKHMWKSVYIHFKENTELLRIMQRLDNDIFRKIEIEVSVIDNKTFQIWATIVFWIMLLIILLGSISVIAKGMPLFTLVVILVFSCIFFIVIGAFILKSVDSLSEEGFLKLISLACVNQIKMLSGDNKGC